MIANREAGVPLAEDPAALAEIVAVARGELPAELLLVGGRVVNVLAGRIEETAVALHRGVVAGLGERPARARLDLGGLYLCPGFIDGHLHVESTLLAPAELARAVCPHGTSAVVADPHEIANVMGAAGVRALLAGSAGLPVEFFFMAPSCVPAPPGDRRGSLDAAELKGLLASPRVLGLGEVMNFPGLLARDPVLLAKLAAFAGRPIDGHAPLLGGQGLDAYLAAGPESDHECTNRAEAAEKLAKGLWLMIREGTSAKNLAELLPLVTAYSERRCLLVSDDRHPDDLAREGHLDHLLSLAVGRGLDPILALRLVTLNPARRFGLARRGAIAPGWRADLVAVRDLRNFGVELVFQAGRLVARAGRCLDPCRGDFPPEARRTLHPGPLAAGRFALPVGGRRARAIELIPGQILTRTALVDTRLGTAAWRPIPTGTWPGSWWWSATKRAAGWGRDWCGGSASTGGRWPPRWPTTATTWCWPGWTRPPSWPPPGR